ncbi:hypothetical protein LSG31_14100 [Fodinisporobacter ferrooxydans]|uniref:Uncharacterized protein n=1 Tax=Fodinisporobacter ferrooxydans TaxID=2901836 RepID=A0ABY4CI31_9BACL|nr:hypothetical protein LSG31_14100 [Alicyclobacillaceae bacterium MYW30-H2]
MRADIKGLLGGLVIMLVSVFLFFLDYRFYKHSGGEKPFKRWLIREMFKNPFGSFQLWVFQKNVMFLLGLLLFVFSVLVMLGIGKGNITVQ